MLLVKAHMPSPLRVIALDFHRINMHAKRDFHLQFGFSIDNDPCVKYSGKGCNLKSRKENKIKWISGMLNKDTEFKVSISQLLIQI